MGFLRDSYRPGAGIAGMGFGGFGSTPDVGPGLGGPNFPAGGGTGGGLRRPPTTTPPITPQAQQPMGGMDLSQSGMTAAGPSSFMQAFSNNPAFQQQLGAMMSGQSPGFMTPLFQPMPQAVNMGGQGLSNLGLARYTAFGG